MCHLHSVQSEFTLPEDWWTSYLNKDQIAQCRGNLANLLLLVGEVLYLTVPDEKLHILIILYVRCQFKRWRRHWSGYNQLEIGARWRISSFPYSSHPCNSLGIFQMVYWVLVLPAAGLKVQSKGFNIIEVLQLSFTAFQKVHDAWNLDSTLPWCSPSCSPVWLCPPRASPPLCPDSSSGALEKERTQWWTLQRVWKPNISYAGWYWMYVEPDRSHYLTSSRKMSAILLRPKVDILLL